ncbi:hypothetical protein HN011_012193 [Eciton burchellii]|nr:hypothetical protein HN011_012193 [Eciton burchellii]
MPEKGTQRDLELLQIRAFANSLRPGYTNSDTVTYFILLGSDQHRRIDLAMFLRRLNLSANAKSHLTPARPERVYSSCFNQKSLIISFGDEIESFLCIESLLRNT